MTKTYYHYVEKKHSESGQTGTATYDLPETGWIPEIVVRVFSTLTASTNPAIPTEKLITKIEIVDGATTLVSAAGYQLKALYMYLRSRSLAMTETAEGGVEGYDDIVIPLGGIFNGRKYCPDFSRFNNPQIKITWDASQTTGPHGESFDADTSPGIKITVLCKVLRDASGYSHGFVKFNSIKTWTQAASTTTVTEIPRGEPLLGIMIDAGYNAKNWTDDVNKIKLDFNNGEWVPLELDEEEIVPIQQDWFGGPFEISYYADVKDSVDIDTRMGFVTSFVGTGAESGTEQLLYAWPFKHLGVETISVSGASGFSSYKKAQFKVTGYIPFQCYYIPMKALLDGGQDTLDTTQYRRIELETTSSSNASTSSTPEILTTYLITR